MITDRKFVEVLKGLTEDDFSEALINWEVHIDD